MWSCSVVVIVYLHWEPKLGFFVDFVELDDVTKGVGVTLSKKL